MPYAGSKGARLYYEEAGRGLPIVFVHEFGGDHRSWEPQMRFFSRRYRCIAFSARGYPPSSVPKDSRLYTQTYAADDVAAVLDRVDERRAHVVGLSQGGYATLHFALRHPGRVLSAVVAGIGYGSVAAKRAEFVRRVEGEIRVFATEGAEGAATRHAEFGNRVQFQNKDRRGWAEFRDRFKEHSVTGSINTLRGLPLSRPTVYALESKLKRMKAPVLIVMGDEDESCLEPGLFLKRTIPKAGLWVFPKTGHVLNLEEPALFNRAIAEFLCRVEAGRWDARDPRAAPA